MFTDKEVADDTYKTDVLVFAEGRKPVVVVFGVQVAFAPVCVKVLKYGGEIGGK